MEALTSVLVQVIDSKHRYELSIQFDYAHPDMLIRAINDAITVLNKEGTMDVRLNHLKGLQLNGVTLERKDKIEERNEHYYRTGN